MSAAASSTPRSIFRSVRVAVTTASPSSRVSCGVSSRSVRKIAPRSVTRRSKVSYQPSSTIGARSSSVTALSIGTVTVTASDTLLSVTVASTTASKVVVVELKISSPVDSNARCSPTALATRSDVDMLHKRHCGEKSPLFGPKRRRCSPNPESLSIVHDYRKLTLRFGGPKRQRGPI